MFGVAKIVQGESKEKPCKARAEKRKAIYYPDCSPSFIRFFIRKKAFTPSHKGVFRLIFSCFGVKALFFKHSQHSGTFIPLTS